MQATNLGHLDLNRHSASDACLNDGEVSQVVEHETLAGGRIRILRCVGGYCTILDEVNCIHSQIRALSIIPFFMLFMLWGLKLYLLGTNAQP